MGCLFYGCNASVLRRYFIGMPKVNKNAAKGYAKVKRVNETFPNGANSRSKVKIGADKCVRSVNGVKFLSPMRAVGVLWYRLGRLQSAT
jgi:hypothetical protein